MCPISSSEIAQMNGAFQGAAMQQMQYSSAIGQGGGVYGGGYQAGGAGGDRAMSGAMNMVGAVGNPMMSGAMGMLGLDPMSLGLKAGMGAFMGGAGIGGAAMAGGAVALPLMAGGAAVHYAGQQMMTGANQQMELNQQLRGSFGFKNQYGGQGFQRSEMSSIGSMVREMSEQFGPGGEITSMKELSGLAGKMGSMGFAQGVKDVKDFTTRFKDMVKTLKTMATDLGTTLEGAMEFAQAAKGSGVFGMGRMSGFTSAARQASVSGGVAMSEVTGAASIGSQISRGMGGLGRQGAMAGIRTMGQIGTAQQMGLLSEEDIYNVTGQTGAEGRQAYAASSMASSAKFLQSGRGRRMLASMAGKDGTLDESAVEQFLSGGMSIEETMRLDKKNVTGAGAPVNRANFIRNEGRLRGAALERLGGFLPAMQMQEWAQSKGIDINNMDDRSMLFAQRQLGMGRDEVDQAIKMANNMPQIMREMKRSEASDQYFQNVAQARKGQGVEGVKQRFEQAKELINGKLQKAGQDVFNQGAEFVDSFFNKLMGTYVETYSKNIDDQYRSMMMGSKSSATAFGGGSAGGRLRAASGGASFGGKLGGAMPQDLAASLNSGSQGGFFDSLSADGSRALFGGPTAMLGGQTAKFFAQGQSGASKLKEAGIDITGMNSSQIQAKLQTVHAMQQAAATGFNEDQVKTGAGGDFLRRAYAMGTVASDGPERVQKIKELIDQQANGQGGDKNTIAAKAMQTQLQGKSEVEQAKIIANYERGQGIEGGGALAAHLGGPEGGISALLAKQGHGGFGSPGEANTAFAKAMGFDERSRKERLGGSAINLAARGLIGGALGGVASSQGQELLGRMTGSYQKEQAAGAFYKSDEFRGLSERLYGGDKETANAARLQIEKDLAAMPTKGLSDEDQAVNTAKREMLRGADYVDFYNSKGGKPTPAEEEEWAKKNGYDLQNIKKTLGSAADTMEATQKKNQAEAQRRNMARAGKEVDKLGQLGLYDADTGELTAQSTDMLAKLGPGARLYANASLKTLKTEAGGNASPKELQRLAAKQQRALETMSIEDKRAFAASGLDTTGEAGYQASIQDRLRKNRKGRAGSVADVLGVQLSPEELKTLGNDNEAIAKSLAQKAGAGGNKEVVDKLLVALKSGKDLGVAAGALSSVSSDPAVLAQQRKKQEAEQEASDPLSAAIKANTKRANDLLEALLKSSKDGTAALNNLDANTKSGDPEKVPK